ncbi:MAG: nuclear transport factor 2 family protein [Planctomycetota bacterium]
MDQNHDVNAEAQKLLSGVYDAFNSRDIERALKVFAEDVLWPRAFKGGSIEGRGAVREYWREQWSEIDPSVEPTSFVIDEDGCILINVHQIVRDLDGNVTFDGRVGHRITLEEDLIRKMEICDLPSSDDAR